MHSGTKEKDGELVFNIEQAGEYTFCFSNQMSTVTTKIVEFEMELPEVALYEEMENFDKIMESFNKIHHSVDEVHKKQTYFKTREAVCSLIQFLTKFTLTIKKIRNTWSK